MGQLVHGSGRTPTAVLRAIQQSQESLIDRTSAFAYAGLHTEAIKTVAVQSMRNLIVIIHDKVHPILAMVASSLQIGNTIHISSNTALYMYVMNTRSLNG
jgi:hypothetical protein